jgi:hypothetical protein
MEPVTGLGGQRLSLLPDDVPQVSQGVNPVFIERLRGAFGAHPLLFNKDFSTPCGYGWVRAQVDSMLPLPSVCGSRERIPVH